MSQSYDSSRTRTTSLVQSITYRNDNLVGANIWFGQISTDNLPSSIQEVERYISEIETLLTPARATQFKNWDRGMVSSSLQADDDLRALYNRAKDLSSRIQDLFFKDEDEWQKLAEEIFSVITLRQDFSHTSNKLWDVPSGPPHADLYPLSTPKPDLGIGLKVFTMKDGAGSIEAPTSLDVLTQPFLDRLRAQLPLQPYPSLRAKHVAYPFLVYECKSDTNRIYIAENQAAGAAAKMLSMIASLYSAASSTSPFPVIVIVSEGSIWKVYLAFQITQNPRVGTVSQYEIQAIRC